MTFPSGRHSEDPRLAGESLDAVDVADEGWDEDTEDPGDDVGTL